MAMMPRDGTDGSATPQTQDAARELNTAGPCDSPDYDALYCERWREKGRYELVCDSIKADIAEQPTAHSRRVCAARYKGAVDRLLNEAEDTTDTFGGAA